VPRVGRAGGLAFAAALLALAALLPVARASGHPGRAQADTEHAVRGDLVGLGPTWVTPRPDIPKASTASSAWLGTLFASVGGWLVAGALLALAVPVGRRPRSPLVALGSVGRRGPPVPCAC
jgi:hypothetical protein